MQHEHQLRGSCDGVRPQNQGEDDALQDAPAERHVAGVLGDLAAAGLAFVLLQVLELGKRRGEQLQDDRGVDERQDPQAEHPQGGNTTAGENVEEADQLAAAGDEILKGNPIDAGHRDIDPQAYQQQQAQGDQHAVAQILGLNQLGEDFTGTGVATPADEHGGRAERRENKKPPGEAGRLRQAAPTLTGRGQNQAEAQISSQVPPAASIFSRALAVNAAA